MSSDYTFGIHHLKAFLDPKEQQNLLVELRQVVKQSPLFTPTMLGGVPFRYRMTNCGALGWVAQNGRFYYTDTHPATKMPWGTMPSSLQAIAWAIASKFGEPDYELQSCLVNIYQGKKQSLGLHQDNSEKRLDRMIISISLGASGIFCLGGFERKGSLQKFLLNSGDILMMAGRDRLRFHSFKGNVAPAPYGLLKGDPMIRINLTIRQVF